MIKEGEQERRGGRVGRDVRMVVEVETAEYVNKNR